MRRLLSIACLMLLLCVTSTTSQADPQLEPPEIDAESLLSSIRLRQGLTILERYESFHLRVDQRGIVVETEAQPADSLRLEALGWDSGPGMQSWVFELPKSDAP